MGESILIKGAIVVDATEKEKNSRGATVIKLFALILLLSLSSAMLLSAISALPSDKSLDADAGSSSDDFLVVDNPSSGIAPYDGAHARIGENEIAVSASAAFLSTVGGQVLYAKKSNTKLPMASITKVMTALVVIENTSDLNKKVNVSPLAVGIEGSSVYLKAGDTVTVLDLLYALMLSSANDAAVALAINISGSIDAFVSIMNTKATELGMDSTSFTNPHGLSSDGHYTTARDYGLLMSYAIRNTVFKEISGTVSRNILINDVSRPLYNHNRLLHSCEGVISGKTGYTIASGRTLVTVAERNGITLVCVTLNAPDDWNDHKRLYNIGFSLVKAIEFNSEELSFELPITGASDGCVTVSVAPKRDVRIISTADTEYSLRYNYPAFIYAPVSKGARVGYLRIIGSNGEECTIALVASFDVAAQNNPRGMLWRLNTMWRALTNKEKD